ncbi:MAG: leucine--tRNA ligase [Nitrosopumilaceae archaeon]|nr:leucine--tRNA ligase [Nitrosopumilaceae archaeon]
MISWNDIETKWRTKWSQNKEFEIEPDNRPKKFITVAYPYPNSPQHIGHGRTYTLADVHARFLRMNGYNTLFPMGFHYTGTPILGMAKRVQEGDKELIENFEKLYHVPPSTIKEFVEPVKIADYFHEEIKQGMIEMGYSIDWRREFTTIDPVYKKFIEWQFRKLKSLNFVVQGSHPVGWCPKDQNPVSQHDTLGDVEPDFTEYILVKFHLDDMIIPTATLRPETIFGVTNLWINPQIKYKKIKVDDEIWIVSPECAYKLEFLNKSISTISEISGSELIGKQVTILDKKIPMFPASFVESQTGTGIVMSVPAHAPFDYQALVDYQKQNSSVKIAPIPIIKTEGFGEIPAMEVVQKIGITSQDDPKLDEATNEVYSKEFYSGVLRENTGKFAGLKVSEAKDTIKAWLAESKNSDILLELNDGPIRCRCGAECVVKLLNNQWFLNYLDQSWKERTNQCFEKMSVLPNEIRTEFNYVVGWLRQRACARQHGLGTNLPWDQNWIVESLSDSVIYMAYYIFAKYVNSGELKADTLSDEFFEFVFYGIGDVKQVSAKCGVSENILVKIRTDFSYFYPVDARHSGRDLVPNHLTFFVLNHVAIFPESLWPKQIVVNGSVLMDGKKMSKSMGNIIPLRKAIADYGADPIRLAIIISAELLQDADFNLESVNTIKSKLETIYEDCAKYKPGMPAKLQSEDNWILGRLDHLINQTTGSVEKMRLREALHHILFSFESDLQWYLKRIEAKGRTDISGILHKVLSVRVAMLSPFAPHIAEEMWERLRNPGSVSRSAWPTPNNSADSSSIQSEELLQSTLEDIKNVLKVTKITPQKIVLYTADSWKVKAFQKIASSVVSGQTNIGAIIKDLIANPETENIKKDPDFVKKSVNSVLAESAEMRKLRVELEPINEVTVLSDELSTLVKKEFGVDLQVFVESDSAKYDPKKKAGMARPFKPALFIE